MVLCTCMYVYIKTCFSHNVSCCVPFTIFVYDLIIVERRDIFVLSLFRQEGPSFARGQMDGTQTM